MRPLLHPRPEAPGWLVARPVAHRGLHDPARALVENSLDAARAAVAHGYAIECDVQRAADGEAMVFHDFELDRLTGASGPMEERSSAELRATPYRQGDDRISTLSELLDEIAGRVPLVCEIKGRFDGDLRLTRRVQDILSAYPGPVAIKSFDPEVVAALREAGVTQPLGVVAEAHYDDPYYAPLTQAQKRAMAAFEHAGRSRPDFVSFHVGDLPHPVPHLMRAALGCPVLTWTVRTPEQRQIAATWADQIVFEGFTP